MCKIKINDNSYQGDSVEFINGRVVIDGKDVTPDSKEINISVVGNVETLEVVACNNISVVGNVKVISTQNGDVHVTGDVGGAIATTKGNVSCGDVEGSISSKSGDVSCGDVQGSVYKASAI